MIKCQYLFFVFLNTSWVLSYDITFLYLHYIAFSWRFYPKRLTIVIVIVKGIFLLSVTLVSLTYLATDIHVVLPSSYRAIWYRGFEERGGLHYWACFLNLGVVSHVLTVSLHVAVPLLSRILPSDACKIYKQGLNIRQVLSTNVYK